MAIVLPVFEVREKLTAEKMNAFRDAVESKFAGGITPADWSWPFVVQGNIDFAGTYGIVGLKTFWNLINAQEYINAGGTLQSAIDKAQTDGGGCVIIPPDTTIETNGVNLTGSLTTIMGYGHSSVLKLSNGSSTGFFFQTSTGGMTDIAICNVAFDGQNTGTTQAGVIARRVNRFIMDNVYMKNFSGPFIKITHDGTPGNNCSNVVLSRLLLTGGTSSTGQHILVEDVDGLQMTDITSTSCPDLAIDMEPTGPAGLLKNISMSQVRVTAPTGSGISILGASATPDAKWSLIELTACRVSGATSSAFVLGNANKLLQDVVVTGCSAPQATTDGLRIAAQRGEVTGCLFSASSAEGIDMQNSIDLWVHGNNCKDAGTYAINASSTTGCDIDGNNCRDAVTGGILKTSATDLWTSNNIGAAAGTLNSTGSNIYADQTQYSRSSAGNFVTYSLKANTVRPGMQVRLRAYFSTSSTTVPIRINIGSANVTTDINCNGTLNFDVIVNAVASPSSSRATGFALRDIANDSAAINTVNAIDWTIDNTISWEYVSGSDAVDMRYLSVELIGYGS